MARHSPQPPKTLKQAAWRYGCAKAGSDAEAEALAQLCLFCLSTQFPTDARPVREAEVINAHRFTPEEKAAARKILEDARLMKIVSDDLDQG